MPVYNFPTLSIKPDGLSLEVKSPNPAFEGQNTDGGYWITRRKYTRTPPKSYIFDLTPLTNDDKNTLLTFWNTVGGSSAIFNWTNPQDGLTYSVRFGKGYELSFKRLGGGTSASGIHYWEVNGMVLTEV